MKIVSSIKTLASNIRFLCTVDMQKQHKLLKQIERTQLRQEDDIEGFGHRLDDMPESIEQSVSSAMDNYEIEDDIRDAVDAYDFTPYLEELAENIDVSDEIREALGDIEDNIDFDNHIEKYVEYNIDFDAIVADHMDMSSIADIVDERIEGNDFGGTFEELTENLQELERQQASLVQGLSVRFGKLAQSLMFSTDWSQEAEVQEAEKVVDTFEEAEDINEALSNANNDPILEILQAVEAEKQSKE